MQKTEFIEHVAKEANVTHTAADKIVRAALKVITDTLHEGDKVTLTGFGSFEVRERGERQVTSIRTKEKITVPASKLPGFSAGSELKAAVNGGKAKEAKETPISMAPAKTKEESSPEAVSKVKAKAAKEGKDKGKSKGKAAKK
jgi:DNA-binding protein HU-beta